MNSLAGGLLITMSVMVVDIIIYSIRETGVGVPSIKTQRGSLNVRRPSN
jgi:hypothetical protein